MFDGSMKQETTFKVTEIYENEKVKKLKVFNLSRVVSS